MINKPPQSRRELRDLLEGWLEADEGEPLPPRVQDLFTLCVEGLKALDHGEVHEIFQPVIPRLRSRRPARIRELQILALRLEAALTRHCGKSEGQARADVAEAYGRSADALDAWEQDLKAESDQISDFGNELATQLLDDRMISAGLTNSGRPRPTEHQIMEFARHFGAEYRELRGQPKIKKKTKKDAGKKLPT